jgi:hypothetical protein
LARNLKERGAQTLTEGANEAADWRGASFIDYSRSRFALGRKVELCENSAWRGTRL